MMKTHGYEAHSITDRGELSPLGTPDPGRLLQRVLHALEVGVDLEVPLGHRLP